jgi:hypothetical protein
MILLIVNLKYFTSSVSLLVKCLTNVTNKATVIVIVFVVPDPLLARMLLNDLITAFVSNLQQSACIPLHRSEYQC